MKFTSTIVASALLATLTIAQTPAPTTTTTSYDEELGCWPISVDHDATYCIDGPICSGKGAQPAGWKCPVAGDVAISDCHARLVSFTENDNCVLPVDTTCQVIHTGAWGCVVSKSGPTPSPTLINSGGVIESGGVHESGPTFNSSGYPGSGSGSGSSWISAGSNTTGDEITFSSIMAVSSAGTISTGAIAAIAAAAAAVCAIVGTILYKRRRQQQRVPAEETNDIDMMFEIRTP